MTHKTQSASIANLATLRLECEPELIKRIWHADDLPSLESVYPDARGVINGFHRTPDLWTIKRACVDKAAGFHGVEYLGESKRSRPWPLPVYYCNAGDTYAPTILFIGPRLVIGTRGDLVERGSITRNGADL